MSGVFVQITWQVNDSDSLKWAFLEMYYEADWFALQ